MGRKSAPAHATKAKGTVSERGIGALPSWAPLLRETDPSTVYVLFNEVCEAVTPSHLRELLELSERAEGPEGLRALGVLMRLAGTDDQRMDGGTRTRVLEAARRAARDEYPLSPRGVGAFAFLIRLNDPAAKAVLEATDVAALSDAQRRAFVTQTHRVWSDRILSQIRKIKALGGEAGARAVARLEAEGLPDMETIRELAANWRKNRSQEVLHELYLRYFTHMGGKVTIGQVVKLMGPPDRRQGKSIWYSPNDWCSVYLEGDSKGVLRAMNFSG
jgi:hypothetical protein